MTERVFTPRPHMRFQRSVVDGMKRCPGCDTTKPVEAFSKSRKHYLECYCKVCRSASRKAERAAFTWDIGAKVLARFWANVNDEQHGAGCWEWKGNKDKNGYGFFFFNGRQLGAHRVSWKIAGNDVPEWPDVIDHRCYNVCCVNPAHLRVVWQPDNANKHARRDRRSDSMRRVWAEKRNEGHSGGVD